MASNLSNLQIILLFVTALSAVEGFRSNFKPHQFPVRNSKAANKCGDILSMGVSLGSSSSEPFRPSQSRSTFDSNSKWISQRAHGKPLDLPLLTLEEQKLLANGERVERQTREGKTGTGFACVDVKASQNTIWSVLLDFQRYPDYIDTVRGAKVFEEQSQTTKAEFLISRFNFPVRTVLTYEEENSLLKFCLDPEGKVPAGVFKFATGYWFLEESPSDPELTRVWLKGDLKVSRTIPGCVVDYGAKRALPRASSWLKPTLEQEERIRSNI